MDTRCRHFALVFTLAATAITPAFAQAVAPTPIYGGSENVELVHPGFIGRLEPFASRVRAAVVGSYGADQPVTPRERHGQHPQASAITPIRS